MKKTASRLATTVAFLLTMSATFAGGAPQGIEVTEASIDELQAAMAAGTVTSADLVDAYLARVAAYDKQGPRLNAILTLNPRAREEAAALDQERRDQGPRGRLHGIPIILKDNYDTADYRQLGGTRRFRPGPRRLSGAQASRGGCRHTRQIEPARDGDGDHLGQLARRPDFEPL